MSTSQIALKHIFHIKDNKQLRSKFSEVERSKVITGLKENELIKVAGFHWHLLYTEILMKLNELLNIKVLDVFIDAWIKNDILKKHTQIKEASPDETILIPLAEHSIKSQHHPYLEILLNENVVAKVNFEIIVSFNVKGIILKIQNKKLIEISTGECMVEGDLICENIKIFEIELRKIELPGVIKLENGKSIITD